MIAKKISKSGWKKFIFGCFLGIITILGVTANYNVQDVLAEPVTEPTYVEVDPGEANGTGAAVENTAVTGSVSCEDSLGALGWLVCPTTGKISEAVDWLYDKIESILVISPVKAEDGQPIYEIWKYFRGVTNIVFIIFLLVVIYSQITGLGISNYGIKKTLPKLIVTAVLVNLSFIICALAVDVSNVIGNGLRGLFESIETATMSGMQLDSGTSHIAMAEMYSAMAGGTALAVGAGVIAFETGAIWMLIPVALGAIVAVASGLITIAFRQAVVSLLIMIAPLAIVAYMLPNTEQWFKKWKQLFTRMLVFYPAFSLLFGASSLAGWAIIASASDGFGLLLGTAVQIFPLFFSWKLMKMSGTFLESVNMGIRKLAAGPLATNHAWADSHRELTKYKNLASNNVYTPSLRLRQFLANRRISREEETKEYSETVKSRGLAYNAKRNYRGQDLDGTLSRKGRRSYEAQARNAEYQGIVLRHTNNMNKGFGYRATEGTIDRARLDELDIKNVKAFDALKAEQARGEKIDYENAVSFHQRMEAAINAHMDELHGGLVDGNGNLTYKKHFSDSAKLQEASERYSEMKRIMEGNVQDVQYIAASAAQGYDTQTKIIMTKFQKYFELTPPTQDVMYRLREFSIDENKKAIENIDSIITGMRILNQRGDTDLVKSILDDLLNEGVDLGTHASQSLASFLMFDVKDNDPFLRRFGKYINLETARVYNSNDRKETKITYDEYVKGYHEEPDGTVMYAKRPMSVLMEGTSLDSIERTALSNLDDSLKKVYRGSDGKLDVDAWLKKREEIETAMGPQFISASLKYLSGSEQLKSAVNFLTGYSYKQVKENGQVVVDGEGNPVYEWEPMWEDSKERFTDDEKAEAEAYFRRKTQQYFKDQTPTQILGLRSDYKAPVMEHLSNAWLDDPQHPERRAEYDRKVAEIQTRYGDLPAEEAKRKRKADIDKLKMEMTGEQLRGILSRSGKLEQIYRTRRSGAANNAKDWLRAWLNLDNEVEINETLRKSREEQKRQYEEARRNNADVNNDEPEQVRIYSDADRVNFVTEIEDLYTEFRDDDSEVFYEESMNRLKKWFGEDSFMAYRYEKYYENNQDADIYDMREYLKSLLEDPDNYPDA